MSVHNIKTAYWLSREVVKTNAAIDCNRAVAQCVAHMQVNRYGATMAEVYDVDTGQLYAQINRSVRGDIRIAYQYNPQDYARKLALSSFL